MARIPYRVDCARCPLTVTIPLAGRLIATAPISHPAILAALTAKGWGIATVNAQVLPFCPHCKQFAHPTPTTAPRGEVLLVDALGRWTIEAVFGHGPQTYPPAIHKLPRGRSAGGLVFGLTQEHDTQGRPVYRAMDAWTFDPPFFPQPSSPLHNRRTGSTIQPATTCQNCQRVVALPVGYQPPTTPETHQHPPFVCRHCLPEDLPRDVLGCYVEPCALPAFASLTPDVAYWAICPHCSWVSPAAIQGGPTIAALLHAQDQHAFAAHQRSTGLDLFLWYRALAVLDPSVREDEGAEADRLALDWAPILDSLLQ